MSSTKQTNVKQLYHRPYAQRYAKDSGLPANDIQLRISCMGFRGDRSLYAECRCAICRHMESYKPRGPAIPDGNTVLMDQRIQKCVQQFNRRGCRRIGDAIVCKECRSFCEQFNTCKTMIAKRTQLILHEIMEWGKNGITLEMVKERWRGVEARHRDLADSWYGRPKE